MYACVLFVVRLLGKRGIGQLAPLDFVIIIALGSATGGPMFCPDVPLLHAMVAATTIVLFTRGLVYLVQSSQKLEDFVSATTTELVRDGVMDLAAMRQRASPDPNCSRRSEPAASNNSDKPSAPTSSRPEKCKYPPPCRRETLSYVERVRGMPEFWIKRRIRVRSIDARFRASNVPEEREIGGNGRRSKVSGALGSTLLTGGCGYEDSISTSRPCIAQPLASTGCSTCSIGRGAQSSRHANWPPYNIEKLGDDQYRITMAVAGFSPDEIELIQQENMLLVAGHKHPEPRASSSCIAASRPAPSSRPSTWLTT